MSNEIQNNYIPQTTQTATAGATQSVPAAQPAPETVNETAFDASQTAVDTADTAGMDTFVPSSGASVEEITAQQQALAENNAALQESESKTQTSIESLETRVANQENYIDKLTDTNTNLQAEITALQNGLDAKYEDLAFYNDKISSLESQISSAEGIIGGFINGVKNATGLFGGGVNVNELKQQLASYIAKRDKLQASIEEDEKAVTEKGGQIDTNKKSIANTEKYKKTNEEKLAEQEAQLAEIQEAYKQGKITEEQLQAALDEAYKAAAEEKGTTEKPSEEQKQGTTAAVTDILTNGTLNVDSMNAIGNAIASQDTTTGKFNAEVFKPAYEEAGFAPEEIGARIEIIEAIANYAELGLAFEPEMLENASVIQLDAMVESAIVQDVMRSTSTKIIGSAANFTSKKDMQEYSDTVDDFISTHSTLNSYYQSNDVNDLEVNAFLNLSNDKISKINQGYVYSTSELQKTISDANTMMTSLKTKASSEEANGESANIQFEESKNKTEDAIDTAEGQLNGKDDDGTVEDFRAEFLNLTNKYNNSDSDSAKQISIKAMEALYERALNADNGVDKDPFRNSLNIAA